jgi:hypothetical protein
MCFCIILKPPPTLAVLHLNTHLYQNWSSIRIRVLFFNFFIVVSYMSINMMTVDRC